MKVSRLIQFHYCLPFEFTAATVAIPKRERERIFPKIEELTKSTVISWKATPIKSPIYIRDTRGEVLYGDFSKSFLDSFLENEKGSDEHDEQYLIWEKFTESLSANAVYYDYGVGAVILRSNVLINGIDDVKEALDQSKKFVAQLIDKFFERPEIDDHFEMLGRSLFEDSNKSPLAEITASSRNWKRLDDFGETAIFDVSDEVTDGFSADEEQSDLLSHTIRLYCGDFSRAPAWTERIDGVSDFCVGLSSNALILTGNRFSLPVNLIQMLEFCIMNLSLLNAFTTDQREILRETSFDKNLSKTLEHKVEYFEDLGTIFDTVEYDLMPANYIANAYEGFVFQRIWEGWRGDDLNSSYQKVKSAFKSEVEKAKSRIARRAAAKVSALALTFTIISLGGFIAALISLYDIRNTIIEPNVRIAIVFIGIFFFGFLTGVITLNLASVFKKPKKLEID